MSTTSPNPAPAESIPKPPIDPELPAPLSMGDVMRIPMLRRVWYAQVISVFGDFLALFAVIASLRSGMHGTPAQVTGLQIAYMLPIVFVGTLAGVFVDRWPLKPTLVSSDASALRCVCCCFRGPSIWHFYVVLAAISVRLGFFSSCADGDDPLCRSAAGLRSANALMQSRVHGSRIVGPAIAGVMVGLHGTGKVCYIC